MSRGLYECQLCLKQTAAIDLQVDHVKSVGSINGEYPYLDWTNFVYNMFFGEMQAICRDCHKKKTKEERKK